jgi:hypothetical protein
VNTSICRICGGLIFYDYTWHPRHVCAPDPDETLEMPAITTAPPELTSEQAGYLYQQALQTSLQHLKECKTCKYFAKNGEVCMEMKRLRKVRDGYLILKVMI